MTRTYSSSRESIVTFAHQNPEFIGVGEGFEPTAEGVIIGDGPKYVSPGYLWGTHSLTADPRVGILRVAIYGTSGPARTHETTEDIILPKVDAALLLRPAREGENDEALKVAEQRGIPATRVSSFAWLFEGITIRHDLEGNGKTPVLLRTGLLSPSFLPISC